MNKEDFNKYTNIVKKEDEFLTFCQKIKSSKLYEDLNLTNEEISNYAILLEEGLVIKEKCKKNSEFCETNNKFHLKFHRNRDNILEICAISCPYIKKKFLYNTYLSADISKVKFNSKYFKDSNNLSLHKLFDEFKRNVTSDVKNHGFYIFGDFGVGKTYFTFAIGNYYLNKGKSTVFITLSDLISKIKNSFDNDDSKKQIVNNLINILITCDVLLIDDIGAEPVSEWFFSENLMNILNLRLTSSKITYFNSNYSLDDLEKLFSKRYNSKDPAIAKRLMNRIRGLVNNKNFLLEGKNRRY
ncbi:MAG: ATP-binding protein [Mycoplasmoidaceae bacterium]